MPKRSNSFQRIVTAIYKAIAPYDAVVEESAMIDERTSGTDREVDILISFPAMGITMRIAVECRDHERKQSIEWIDALIGKYKDTNVDKIIAVSDSGFTKSALDKAKNNNIELVQSIDIDDKDWYGYVKDFKSILVKHFLLIVAAFDDTGKEIILCRREDLDYSWNFKNDLSRDVFSKIEGHFFDNHSVKVRDEIEEKMIMPKWTDFKDGDKRYSEITVGGDFYLIGSNDIISLSKIIYGVGTIFSWETMWGNHKSINGFLVSEYRGNEKNMTLISRRNSNNDGSSIEHIMIN